MVGWEEGPVQETDCVGAWESSSSDRYGVFYMIIKLKYHASVADSQDRIKVMPTLCQGGFRGELRGTMPTPQQNVRNDPHSKGEILYRMAEGPVLFPVPPSSPMTVQIPRCPCLGWVLQFQKNLVLNGGLVRGFSFVTCTASAYMFVFTLALLPWCPS